MHGLNLYVDKILYRRSIEENALRIIFFLICLSWYFTVCYGWEIWIICYESVTYIFLQMFGQQNPKSRVVLVSSFWSKNIEIKINIIYKHSENARELISLS